MIKLLLDNFFFLVWLLIAPLLPPELLEFIPTGFFCETIGVCL